MKVILNVDAVTQPLTGIGRYALNLAKGLQASDCIDDVKFFSSYRWVNDVEHILGKNELVAGIRSYMPWKSAALKLYFFVRACAYRFHAKGAYKQYLLHSPNYLLFPHDGPSVVTLHDFSWWHYPEFHPQERIRLMNKQMPDTYRRAHRFITDSHFVKQEAIEIAGLSAEMIDVVPLGVDDAYKPRSEQEAKHVLKKYGLKYGSYALTVSTLEPRKNLVRLLQAYELLPRNLKKQYPLVLVGVKGWHTDQVQPLAERLECSGDLIRLGYVHENDLPYLYAGARAFVFASLHEGFGLPPLEAMASGVPVVCSDTTSLPEVVGEAACLVTPQDTESITVALECVLSDALLRNELIRKGLRQAAPFTWSRCIDDTISVYQKVLAST